MSCNLKTKKLLVCSLIGGCAVIRSNTVSIARDLGVQVFRVITVGPKDPYSHTVL